jgi:hypothetical protein
MWTFGKTETFMKTRVAATAAFVFLLFSIGILISCNKSKTPQAAQSGNQAATAEDPRRTRKENALTGVHDLRMTI